MSPRGWKAGAATVTITPSEPMWLAGWATRRKPAARAAIELFAKAVALEDAAGGRAVIVTADLIAIPHTLANAVAKHVHARWQLPRERLLFNASHTHTGPEIRPDKVPFFEIPPEFAARIGPYVLELERKLAAVVDAALEKLEPVDVRVHQARAAFGQNRRASMTAVDHDVPILSANRADGSPLALLFGYACHNLTLPPSFCAYHGDYAGVAQARLTQRFPGITALFLAGAGADQDPAPRGTVELAELHGQALADAIETTLHTEGAIISSGELRVAYENVTLDLQPLPSMETLRADAESEDQPKRRKAAFLLAAIAEQRPLTATQSCPVQVLGFGNEVLLIALGGEPVVDFALQLKAEFRDRFVWVAGYSNDMFGYLPTRAVQQAGGYEAGRATLWSALPMPIAETSEERVLATVRRLVNATTHG